MGGAADFPDRASSPLKRRASSMEPDIADQDVAEDVDMITAPSSDAPDASKSEQQLNGHIATSADPAVNDPANATAEETTQPMDTSSTRQPPESIEAHVKAIRAFVEEQNTSPLTEGQECFLVSRSWLANVPDDLSPKHTVEDWTSIPPVDNSDIVLEVIDDPCVGDGVDDILKKKFVRLRLGYDTEQFEPFPKNAWDLLMKWPGLLEGQIPIRRLAHATTDDGKNVMWEWHPPILTIYRLWSAISTLPIEASLKAKNPPPSRLVCSRSTYFQVFLRQAKGVAGIDLAQRVRAWSVLQPPVGETSPWNHLLLDVESFLALEKGSERCLIDCADRTDQPIQKSIKTLSFFSIAQDQAIVLDPHETATTWTSTLTSSQARTSLPSRNSSTNLTVQNRNAKSGRTSPISQGIFTRGRTKSGKVAGCVGLANLGNTCYMNAALQCVRSVEELTKYFVSGEWELELNKENVLSHNGEVAAAYAHLLKEIYKDPSPGSVSPRQFKTTIGRYSTGFSGYGQQDSQEFLGFLLDGLQEDLSRIKKKPYIEKPDSTDEMVNDPAAIREMADKVWDITKKRDDSVIGDLFTGLYKSTLVCPECRKVSITFDPFNNLTLPLPVENKWSHTIKFFPLNDRPVDIRVELDKHASIKSLKEFLSTKTGVPIERLFGAEEWKGKFYKYYTDYSAVSEEITHNDNVWFFELETTPTNCGSKPKKQQKYGVAVRSMVDEDELNASASWNDEQAEKMLVPVFHRRPLSSKTTFHNSRWTQGCPPHFIIITPEEAKSEDAIRRKVLEKVATFTRHLLFARGEESDGSDNTDLDIIGMGSDAGSSNEGRVVAQSVKGEDDLVDVQMKDGETRSNPTGKQFCHKRPAWITPGSFLPADLQNLFEMCYASEPGAALPTGMNGIFDDRQCPRLSLRIPSAECLSEDQFDNATNGTASNEESSSDEAPRRSTEHSFTRMQDESDDEDPSPIIKVCRDNSYWINKKFRITKSGCLTSVLICDQPNHHRSKQNGRAKGKNRQQKHKNQKIYGKAGKKKLKQRQSKEKQHNVELEETFNTSEPSADGGPLIRLREALVVDWSEHAYNNIFADTANDSPLATWVSCETLPDPELEKAQAARTRRRKHGITLEACLDEFEREEILSEQDMWYCPRCKEHRRASKKFDLWKTPDILVIHLKRFSSSGFRRDKLEVLVEFPLENLDITSRVLQKEDGKQEVYDLIGVDCHWGGLGGGHYTAHAKNFIDGQWYTYNDSSVSRASPDRIVDSSAYLLFYRRRSEIPLGGPRFQQILQKFEGDSDDSELPDSGEGQRLDEGFSRNGSSSALQGAGATHPRGSIGGKSTNGFALNSAGSNWNIKTIDDVLEHPSGDIHRSIEEDEGIDLDDDTVQPGGFQPLTNGNSWSFDNLLPSDIADIENPASESQLDSGAASDVAQHDSSGDEQVLSPRDMDFEADHEPNYPGMSHYELSQPEATPPPYSEIPPPDYCGEMTQDDMHQIWDQKNTIHEVGPGGENDARSEDAAEIHIGEDDKIKLA
ncbi:UCH-domain-containing protein [Daldinia sp. FL1419]|nr:UCH-domain-containing protein [Daldinia sp. FL1419]